MILKKHYIKGDLMVAKFWKDNAQIIVGVILLLHWAALVYDRITHQFVFNLFWVSNLALLLAAIGLVLRSNILQSGALVSVLFGHAVWAYDVIILALTGNAPLSYSSYFFELSLSGKLLTSHHLYLAPTLLIILWSQRKISKYGWIVASLLFVFATLSSFFILPEEYNLNCAHSPCAPALELLPFIAHLTHLSSAAYLIFVNIVVAIVGFALPNALLSWMFGRMKQRHTQYRMK
jgi:hypothetical protein